MVLFSNVHFLPFIPNLISINWIYQLNWKNINCQATKLHLYFSETTQHVCVATEGGEFLLLLHWLPRTFFCGYSVTYLSKRNELKMFIFRPTSRRCTWILLTKMIVKGIDSNSLLNKRTPYTDMIVNLSFVNPHVLSLMINRWNKDQRCILTTFFS